MSRRLRQRRSVAACARGATVVEFALLAPVLLMVMMGICDYAHTLYMVSSLQGVVQKASRDSTIEDYSMPAAQATLDAKVISQIKLLNSAATVPPPTRRYYKTYAAATSRTAETWGDTDHDGTCDHGEQYSDVNNNGVWDADGGDSSGGAKDKVIYQVTVSYPRLFPIFRFTGVPSTVSLSATTVLTNQPYAQQSAYTTPTTRTCS